MFFSLHIVRGFPSFLQLCMNIYAFSNRLQDCVREIGLCLRETTQGFTFKNLWLIDLRSWKDLQLCREYVFPKSSCALPATSTRHLSSRHTQKFLFLICQHRLQRWWESNRLPCFVWESVSQGKENSCNERFFFLAATFNYCCSHIF